MLHIEPAAFHLSEFGAGERSAISLAVEHPAWVLLIDDYRPFLEAMKRGLSAVSTPMFVVTLYRDGSMRAEEALSSLGRLAALKTISPHLFATALAALGGRPESPRER